MMFTQSRPAQLSLLIKRFCRASFLIVLGLAFSQVTEAAPRKSVEKIRAEQVELQQEATEFLQKLGERLEKLGQKEEAQQAFELAEPSELSLTRVVAFPRKMQAEPDRALSSEPYSALTEKQKFCNKHANQLYILGRQAARIGYPSYAYALIHEALRFNPDHQVARKIMGYERHENEWLTPFEKRMAQKDYIEHEQFGWIPEAYKKRYEAGERYYNSSWISAAREQEIRRDLTKAWTIESEHFVLKTNHSLEKGVLIARKLEAFHRFFYQKFQAFFTTPQQMQQLFESSSKNLNRTLGERHQVFYFNTKEEYVSHLARKIPETIINEKGQRVPKISITSGLYLTADRASYFFNDPNARDDSVIYHEATHQIFFESAPRRRQVAENEHFWLMEGIACYMESFEPLEDGGGKIGNILHDRFYAARVRFLEDKHYIPLREFTAMSMYRFQGHPRLQWNYSQASGLTHFFMHYENGRYQDALIEHLVQIYGAAGLRSRPISTLSELTETSYDELDQQYDAYIHAQSDQEKKLLKQNQFNAQVKDLE